ncbi:MAG: hypothetical protein V9E81_08825 [Marmoricola sp.]
MWAWEPSRGHRVTSIWATRTPSPLSSHLRMRAICVKRRSTTRRSTPKGVNIEFVTRVGDHHVAMRVHERGVGETRSCGTGACAAGVAAALADGAERGETYVVDVPGGALEVTWTADDRVLLSGPAVLVAEGTVDL